MNLLAEILSSRARAEISRILFGFEPAELHLREIVRGLGCSIGTVRSGPEGDADFLDSCRSKRNIAEYDRVGVVNSAEVSDFIALVKERREDVLKWLREKHPELM